MIISFSCISLLPHIALTEAHLISWIEVHVLAVFPLHVVVRRWFASALPSVLSCHHYPLSSLFFTKMSLGTQSPGQLQHGPAVLV